MPDLDPQQGRASEELPRLLAIEPWLQGARVVWLGPISDESVEWLHHLGASRVSLVGGAVSKGLRVDHYLASDGLGALPSRRSDVVIVHDMAAKLYEDPELLGDLQRLLAPGGCVFGILPAEGEHVGVDMLAHRVPADRLHYSEVVEQLEGCFDFVTAVAQVPLLAYLVTGTDGDAQLRFDGRIADLGREPPLYHIVGGFEDEPEALPNRIATLSFDKLSDRVGRVVAQLDEASAATRRDATRRVANLEASLAEAEGRAKKAQAAADTEAQAHASAERQRLLLHEQLSQASEDLESQRTTAAEATLRATGLRSELEQRQQALDAAEQSLAALTQRLAETEGALRGALESGEQSVADGKQWKQRAEDSLAGLKRLEEAHSAAEECLLTLTQRLAETEAALQQATASGEKSAADVQLWRQRAEESRADLERVEQAQVTAEEALKAYRAARERDPLAHQLAEERVAQQKAFAATYRLKRAVERRDLELRDVDQRLHRALAEGRHRDHLLAETQARLERATEQQVNQEQMSLLEHLKKQLNEALEQEEALDEARAKVERRAEEAEARVQALKERLDEMDAIAPRLSEAEDDRRRLKEMLDEARSRAEEHRQRSERTAEELTAAQSAQEVLKGQAVELAEVVSNLTARVDLLEGEATGHQGTIESLTDQRGGLERALSDARVLTSSLRRQLEEALNRPPEDVTDLTDTVDELTAALEAVKAQHGAALEALAQSGVDHAAVEKERRQLDLENQRLRAAVAAKRSEPTQRVAELQARLQQTDQERERLQDELASYRARADEAANDRIRIAELEAEQAELSAAHRTMADEVQRLAPFEARVGQLEGLSSDQVRALDEQQQRFDEVQGELATLQRSIEEQAAENEASTARANEAAIAARHAHEQQSAKLEAALATAERRGETQAQQIADLKQQSSAMKGELEARDTELVTLRQRLDEALALQQRLSEAKARTEKSSDEAQRRLAAQAAEAERELQERTAETERILQAQAAETEAEFQARSAEVERQLQEQAAQTERELSEQMDELHQALADATETERTLREEKEALRSALAEAQSERDAERDAKRVAEEELGTARGAETAAHANLRAAEEALEALRAEHERRIDKLEIRHADTLRSSLSQAADIQQAEVRNLQDQLAAMKERAAGVAAQEDRILALVEEQRLASDQAWDLAIASRSARFATLIDRFTEVVRRHRELER